MTVSNVCYIFLVIHNTFLGQNLLFSPTWLYNKQVCHVSTYRDDKEVCSK